MAKEIVTIKLQDQISEGLAILVLSQLSFEKKVRIQEGFL
jgi:hypothetical protein